MNAFDYSETFGKDAERITRGRILGNIVGLDVYDDIPYFRDAWVERGQNPDRAPGVGPIVIAFYTHSNTPLRRKAMAPKVFKVRSNPLYWYERDDIFASEYTTFYFSVPAELDAEIIASLARVAVQPVDTDSRWRIALGYTEEGNPTP